MEEVQGCLTKRQYKNERYRKWIAKNKEKKRMWNKIFRMKNPDYDRKYKKRRHFEKYGVLPKLNRNISMFEQTWTTILEKEFPCLKFEKIRPIWLQNPITKCNLELDMYCKEYKLAIEISGDQHFYYIPKKFHKDIDEFVYQVWKDNFKARRCMELGIKLFVITKRDKKENILSKIHKYLSLSL